MPQNYLRLGDWNAICDVCGFKFKASQLRKRWDNLMVCKQDWEPRHPQDYIHGFEDNSAVPWARPEPEDYFIPFNYICTPEGSTAIAGVAVAGCMVAGKGSATPVPNRSAVAGILVAGNGVAGHS